MTILSDSDSTLRELRSSIISIEIEQEEEEEEDMVYSWSVIDVKEQVINCIISFERPLTVS